MVAVTEELDIYQFKKPDGTLTGYSVDVVSRLAELSSDKLTIRVMPWARAYQTAQQHANTMIFSIARTPKREHLFKWVTRLATRKFYFWARIGDFSQDIYDLDELRKFTIATTIESSPEQFLMGQQFKQLYRVSSYDLAFDLLFNKRVDLIVNTDTAMRLRVEKQNLEMADFYRVLELDATPVDLYLAFNNKTQDSIIERYQTAMLILESSGELSDIKSRWNIN